MTTLPTCLFSCEEMDDEDCERRRGECLDEMLDLEKQFQELKEKWAGREGGDHQVWLHGRSTDWPRCVTAGCSGSAWTRWKWSWTRCWQGRPENTMSHWQPCRGACTFAHKWLVGGTIKNHRRRPGSQGNCCYCKCCVSATPVLQLTNN